MACALTYFLRNKTLPGMPARNPDPRTTDDRFGRGKVSRKQ